MKSGRKGAKYEECFVFLSLMEVNKCLIAALYVMAGCAVTIPLKAQTEIVSWENSLLEINHTVRSISAALEQKEGKQKVRITSSKCYHFSQIESLQEILNFDRSIPICVGSICWKFHRIRAPGCTWR